MWLNCPASITLAKGMTRPSSLYAKEGTAAHQIAQKSIEGDLFPPGKIKVEGSEFIVGLPMLGFLNPYITFAQSLMGQADEWYCEKQVKINDLVWGTTDFAARRGSVLDIVDLKYGKGVPVAPGSAQLKIYAIASYLTLWDGYHIDTINLTVVQPRINMSPQTVTMTSEELMDWKTLDLTPAIERLERNDTTEKYGAWCRWCVRKHECNAFKNHKNSAAAETFDDGVDTLNN
jgi:hypothetical protein